MKLNAKKTTLWGFEQSEAQTSLFCYRDYFENWNFASSKLRYDSFKKAKSLISLHLSAGWAVPLLFSNPTKIDKAKTLT